MEWDPLLRIFLTKWDLRVRISYERLTHFHNTPQLTCEYPPNKMFLAVSSIDMNKT